MPADGIKRRSHAGNGTSASPVSKSSSSQIYTCYPCARKSRKRLKGASSIEQSSPTGVHQRRLRHSSTDVHLFDHFVGASEQRGRGESEEGGRSCYSSRTVQHHPGLEVVRRKFHDDTKRGGTCRQPAQAVI
jgi:hypothetical protein